MDFQGIPVVLKVGPRKVKELNMVVFCFKNCSDLGVVQWLRGQNKVGGGWPNVHNCPR